MFVFSVTFCGLKFTGSQCSSHRSMFTQLLFVCWHAVAVTRWIWSGIVLSGSRSFTGKIKTLFKKWPISILLSLFIKRHPVTTNETCSPLCCGLNCYHCLSLLLPNVLFYLEVISSCLTFYFLCFSVFTFFRICLALLMSGPPCFTCDQLSPPPLCTRSVSSLLSFPFQFCSVPVSRFCLSLPWAYALILDFNDFGNQLLLKLSFLS